MSNLDWSFKNLFGTTKIPFEGPPFGDTQNSRENNFYRNGFFCYALYRAQVEISFGFGIFD